MYLFQSDYNMMCHPAVLQHLNYSADNTMIGYGKDDACTRAAALIRKACGRDDIAVHFLSGGTQTNLTVIAAALRPYQAVLAPVSAHINEHETGSIEATGHKVITLPATLGKITAQQIDRAAALHYQSTGPDPEHMPQPKMVYISMSTELGSVYSLAELEDISTVCKQWNLYLYVDGARLGYGLAASECDVTLSDLTRLCDVFYIGGTKQGAMFGEAVVIANTVLAEDFRYMIKRQGGMLAKGWLMGLQFEALFTDNLYFKASSDANAKADRIRCALQGAGFETPNLSGTNQVFAIMTDAELDALGKEFLFTEWERVDENRRMIRFCTSWSTTDEQVNALCNYLARRIAN